MRRSRATRGLLVLAAGIFGLILPARPALAQGLTDLLGTPPSRPKGTSASAAPPSFGRDRVDLGLPPGLSALGSPETKSVGFSAQGDLRMICGQYDLKAGLQHLLGREAREEFLDGILQALVGEIVGSGMELLCQAEPTLCTLIQNYSVSANLKMGYYKDLCTAVESALVDAGKKAGATAMDRCLKEKKDQGLSLDRAIEACHHELPQVRGFHGEALAQLDFGKEVGSVFQEMHLSPGAGQLAGRLSDLVVVGPGSSSAQADPRALPQFFDEKRQTYADRLGGLLDQAARREAVAPAELRQALPEGAPPLSPDEIEMLSLLSPDERSAAVGSISSALAIFEMGAQIAEVERALEVLKGVPTVDPAKRELLEDRLARLRSEKLRLAERVKDQTLVQEAYASARRLATRQYSNRVAAVQSRAGEADRKADLLQDTAPVGALPQKTAASLPESGRGRRAPASCESCGLEGSFGSYAAEKP